MKQSLRSVAAVLLPVVFLVFPPEGAYADEASALRSYLAMGHCRDGSESRQLVQKLGDITPALKARLRVLMTGDSDPTVRRCAVSVLAALDDRPPQSLARLLLDNDKRVREAAVYALSGAGSAAVGPVGEILLSAPCRNDSARAAARVLWHLRSAEGVPYLEDVLVDDTGGCVPRQDVLRALEAVRGPAGVHAMLGLLPYRHLTKETYMALSRFWKPGLKSSMISLMSDPSLSAEQRMVYALNFNEIFGTREAQEALVEFFKGISGDSEVSLETRKAAVVLSASFAAGGRALFRAPLDDRRALELAGNPQSRVETKLMALGVRLPRTTAEAAPEGPPPQALVELLLDGDREVREAAEEALVESGRAAVEPVGEILRSAPCDSEGARSAARVLGGIGDGRGAPYVGEILIRNRRGCFPLQVGLQALRDIGGSAAVRVLLALVSFHELAEGAYVALLDMDRQDLRQEMIALMNDSAEPPEMRMSYALTLNEIFGTWAVQEELVKFFGSLEWNPEMPADLRETAGRFAAAFAEKGKGLSTRPLNRDTAGYRAGELSREMKKFERDPGTAPQNQAAVIAFLRTRYQLRLIGP